MEDEQTQPPEGWTDAPLEHYEHRGVDEDGNDDDLYTEEEDLELAKAAGLEFVDNYAIMEIATLTYLGERYSTAAKAKKALAKLDDPDAHTVVQVRERKQ